MDDIELFNDYFVKWKNTKVQDSSSAAIPRFYYKVIWCFCFMYILYEL